jgi:Cu(I)/Ag(I) efflux system membrane fusion protein
MGRIENYISKPKAIIFKKIRRFINSTVKTLQLLNTIFFTAFKQLSMPGDFGKNAKVWNAAKETIILWLSAK